ncbi:MAG: metalloregulator ArsR/SmtB family transcription factor [Candidatus Zixiibacteriota bacterium]
MTQQNMARYEARAKIIKAMAHPARLYIVDLLRHTPLCVAALTEKIGADMSTVSKHLSVLKNAGIVSTKKEKTQVIYSLRMPCVLDFFGCVEKVIESTAKEQLIQLR